MRDRKHRTIQKKGAQSYLLIVRGECPVLPTPQVDPTNLQFTPYTKEWTREVDGLIDRWIEENPSQIIADYRYTNSQNDLIASHRQTQQSLFERVG